VLPNSFKSYINSIIRKKEKAESVDIEINNNNETRFLRVDLKILENILGTEKFILISLTDITLLHQIYKQLEESEEKFRSIFEQAPIGIYRTTPEGNFLLANPKTYFYAWVFIF